VAGAIRPVGEHLVQVRLDHGRQVDDEPWIEGLVQARATKEVPPVDHQVDETEAQVRGGGNVAVRAGDELLGRRHSECVRLLSSRFDDGSDRVVPELVTCELGSSPVAINTCEQ